MYENQETMLAPLSTPGPAATDCDIPHEASPLKQAQIESQAAQASTQEYSSISKRRMASSAQSSAQPIASSLGESIANKGQWTRMHYWSLNLQQLS